MFVEKIYIKCNIWRVAVRPSYIWDARFLKVNTDAACVDERCVRIVKRDDTQARGLFYCLMSFSSQ